MANSVWQGHLVYGPLAFPVRLTKGGRRDRIECHYVCRASSGPGRAVVMAQAAACAGQSPVPGVVQFPAPQLARLPEERPVPNRIARVHRAFVGPDSNIPLAEEDIHLGYEVRRNHWVLLEPGELDALDAPTSRELEIREAVPSHQIDPIFLNMSYYVSPEDSARRPYSLLYYTLAESGYVAKGELAFCGCEYEVVIRPGRRGLVLHTLHFAPDVHSEGEFPADRSLITDEELEMSKQFQETRRATFDPTKLRDKHRDRVMQYLMERAQEAFPASADDSDDLLDALQRSVDSLTKPPQPEGPGTGSRNGRRHRHKRPPDGRK